MKGMSLLVRSFLEQMLWRLLHTIITYVASQLIKAAHWTYGRIILSHPQSSQKLDDKWDDFPYRF